MIGRFLRRILFRPFMYLYDVGRNSKTTLRVMRNREGVRLEILLEHYGIPLQMDAISAAKLSRRLGQASYNDLEGPELFDGDYEIYGD